jgi:hypothetical protein
MRSYARMHLVCFRSRGWTALGWCYYCGAAVAKGPPPVQYAKACPFDPLFSHKEKKYHRPSSAHVFGSQVVCGSSENRALLFHCFSQVLTPSGCLFISLFLKILHHKVSSNKRLLPSGPSTFNLYLAVDHIIYSIN